MAQTFVDEFGVHLNSLSENIEVERERFIKYMGLSDISGSSANGEAIAIVAEAKTRMEQMIADAISSTTLFGANGVRLDQLAEVYGFNRKAASYSIAYITVHGISGTVISKGLEFKTSDKKPFIYKSIRDVTIPATGIITIETHSTKVEAVAKLGDLKMVGVTSGITSTSNLYKSINGNDIETDVELRNRMQRGIASPNTVNLIDGLQMALENLDGVKRVSILDNNTGSVIDGVPDGHFAVTIVGGSDVEIAKTVRLYEGAGCPSFGSISVAIEINQHDRIVHFNRAVLKDADIQVTLTTNSAFNASISNDILSDRILEYVNHLGIGETLHTQKIESMMFIQGVSAATANINGHSTSLQANTDELIVTDKTKISVN